MRRVSQIVVACAIAILFITSCDKDMNLDLKTVVVKENPKVYVDPTSVEISGKYEYPSILKGINVCVSKHEDLSNVKSYQAKVTDHDFSVTIDELQGGTKYYYCYEFDNGMDKVRSSEASSFETVSYADAAINTVDVICNKAKSAVCYGNILSTGGYDVIEYGACWVKRETSNNPTIYHNKIVVGDGSIIGPFEFEVRIENLIPSTDYFARAYAIIDNPEENYPTIYGEPMPFTTKDSRARLGVDEYHINAGIDTASCRYNVYYVDGCLPVYEHGICWSSTIQEPDLDPGHNDGYYLGGDGENTGGNIYAKMTNLSLGTEYYVRVYAKNEDETYYSEPVSSAHFTTHTGVPGFTNFKVTQINHNSAVLVATITDDNGYVNIEERGFVWSKTEPYPTAQFGHCDGSGILSGSYFPLDQLEEDQWYYVRPYAKYNGGLFAYLDDDKVIHFKTTKKGGLTGAFSINDNGDQVCFSQGNLQYLGSRGRWKFAENQWDCLGTTTGQNSDAENVDRDLFGWGTSGNPHGAIEYNPWATSTNYTKYWAYGESYFNLFNGDGQADWGRNRIYINEYNTIPNTAGWRTLTNGEWWYLVQKCSNTGRFSAGSISVNGQLELGHILLPDDWTLPEGLSFTANAGNWSTNSYSESQWDDMEAHGAAFLPVAGYRQGTDVSNYSVSYYWSSNIYGEEKAMRMVFNKTGYAKEEAFRYLGLSVRLVHDL